MCCLAPKQCLQYKKYTIRHCYIITNDSIGETELQGLNHRNRDVLKWKGFLRAEIVKKGFMVFGQGFN